jgi:hypothetical protein
MKKLDWFERIYVIGFLIILGICIQSFIPVVISLFFLF